VHGRLAGGECRARQCPSILTTDAGPSRPVLDKSPLPPRATPPCHLQASTLSKMANGTSWQAQDRNTHILVYTSARIEIVLSAFAIPVDPTIYLYVGGWSLKRSTQEQSLPVPLIFITPSFFPLAGLSLDSLHTICTFSLQFEKKSICSAGQTIFLLYYDNCHRHYYCGALSPQSSPPSSK
jgi:hypothetical protein